MNYLSLGSNKLVRLSTNLIIHEFRPSTQVPMQGQLMLRFDALAWYYGLQHGESPLEIRQTTGFELIPVGSETVVGEEV